jgi:hypothetical protein
VRLRHIVLMKLAETEAPEFLQEMHAAVVELAKAVPEVLATSGGTDASGRDDTYDYALIFDFADAAAYERYRIHPAHQAFIARYMRGHEIDKVRIQLRIDE